MDTDNRLIPECYVDTAMMEAFGFKKPNHQLGNGVVLETLDLPGYNNSIAVGIIDRDKRQPKELDNYTHFNTRRTIEVRRKGNSKKFIIIHPNIEKWTYDEGQRLGINLSNYNLPTDFKAYKNLFKRSDSAQNTNIKNYFNALANVDSDIRILKRMINRLLRTHS